MLTLKQIKTAINDVIIAKYPTIDINANDIEEGFKRPSFFTDFLFTNRTDYAQCFLREITAEIKYFPSSRNNYSIDVLEKQDAIENAIRNGFAVETRHLHIKNDVESEVIDKVLHIKFELEFYDSVDEDAEMASKMEDLYYDESRL